MDKNQKLTKVQYITEDLRSRIKAGEWNDLKCLPVERELCEKYNASRVTVRKALDNLEQDELIYKISGKGTFVKTVDDSFKISQPLAKLTGFSDDMIARGKKPTSQVLLLDIIPASKSISDKLAIQEGDKIILMRRLRGADGIPMAIETDYVSYELFGGVYNKMPEGSFYALMRDEVGIYPRRAFQSIEVTKISNWEAELLGNPKLTEALLMHRQTFDESGRPIEYVVSKYRSDMYKFYIELTI